MGCFLFPGSFTRPVDVVNLKFFELQFSAIHVQKYLSLGYPNAMCVQECPTVNQYTLQILFSLTSNAHKLCEKENAIKGIEKKKVSIRSFCTRE